MKTWSTVLAVVLAWVAPIAHAQTTLFPYERGERPYFQTDFNTTEGLEFSGNIGISNGELRGLEGCYFCAATARFSRMPDLNNSEVSIYYRFRSDLSAGEEYAKAYLSLNLPGDPLAIEPLSIKLNVRPSTPSGFYVLSVDPGFNIPETRLVTLQPPAATFSDLATYESFKVTVRRAGSNLVCIRPYWYNRTTRVWEAIGGQYGSSVPLVATTEDLEGKTTFDSATVQFGYDDRTGTLAPPPPAVDALAVTVRKFQLGASCS